MTARRILLLPLLGVVALGAVLAQGAAADAVGNDFLRGVVRVTQKSALDSEKAKSVTVSCPEGLSVIGGGADVDSPRRGVGIRASVADGNGWTAEAYEVKATNVAWAVQAFAICARTGDPSEGPVGAQGLPGPPGEPGRCLCIEIG